MCLHTYIGEGLSGDKILGEENTDLSSCLNLYFLHFIDCNGDLCDDIHTRTPCFDQIEDKTVMPLLLYSRRLLRARENFKLRWYNMKK